MLINITERAHAEVERIFRVILPESGLTVREEQIALCHSMLDSLLHNTISLCDLSPVSWHGSILSNLVARLLFPLPAEPCKKQSLENISRFYQRCYCPTVLLMNL